MIFSGFPRWASIRALAIVMAIMSLTLVGTASAQAVSLAAPASLATMSRSTTGLALGWSAVPGATRYQMQISTNSTMGSPRTVTSTTNRADVTGLKPATTYFFRARAVTSTGEAASPFSPAAEAQTRAATDPLTLLNPTSLKVTGTSLTTLSLSWETRGAGLRYRVQYSTQSSMANAAYARFSEPLGSLKNLRPGTTYYAKVSVLDQTGARRSDYAPAVKAGTTALSTPTGLVAVSSARTALAFQWAPMADAPLYEVTLSTSSTLSSPRAVYSITPRVELTGLLANRTYYARVRAVSADKSAPYSSWSSIAKGTTRSSSSSYTWLSPAATASPEPSSPSDALRISWTPRDSVRYMARVSATPDMANPTYMKVTTGGAVLGGLREGSTRFLQVSVTNSSGTRVSDYGPVLKATTALTDAPLADDSDTLRVGSYNVGCYLCYSGGVNERPWFERKATVAAVIKQQRLDVLGVQEASQGSVEDPRTGASSPQFAQLLDLLGDQYRLTNDFRYNCRRSTSPNNCSYVDRGASQGTRIYYNAARVTLLDQGSKRLSEINPSDNDRYVSWAIFRQNSTGKRFLFADTHLEAKDGTYLGASYDALRLTQAKEVQAAVTRANVDALPVILVGDLNSSRWSSPANYPYDVFTAGGLVDHLGNVYKNSYALTGADVNHRIRTSYSSFNGYRLAAPRTTYLNGTYIDYILTTPMAMTEYQNVVSVDSAGMFLPVLSGGNVVIPSDHNLQRASVRLP